MSEKVQAWMADEVKARVWDILDVLALLDEDFIKEWVREKWEDPDEVYET